MANIYDKDTDENLRHITGIGHDEERKMEIAARAGADQDQAAKQEAESLQHATGANPAPEQGGEEAPAAAGDEQGDGAQGDTSGDGFYKDDDGESQGTRSKFWTRRKKGAAGVLAGGGVVGMVVTFLLFSAPFKIPTIVGGFANDLPSGRMTRLMVERPFHRLATNYLVAKKAGVIDEVARPGSALSRLYKMFDDINLEDLIKTRTGIEVIADKNVVVDGARLVRVYSGGKEIGIIDSRSQSLLNGTTYKEWKNFQKTSRVFANANKDIFRKALPIFRVGTLSGKMRLWMYAMGFSKGFVPISDETKSSDPASKKTNEIGKEILKSEIDNTVEKAAGQAAEVLDCTLGNEEACAAAKRIVQAVDVSDPEVLASSGLSGEREVSNEAAQDVEDQIKDNLSKETEDLTKPTTTKPTEGIMTRVLQRILGEVAGKVLGDLLPVIGWIDVMAQLQHFADTQSDSNIIMESIVKIREYQAASVGAEWLGNADNIKDFKLSLATIVALNSRMIGYREAAMVRTLYHLDGSGVPVGIKVGSDGETLSQDLASQFYGIDTKTYINIVNCKSISDFRGYNIGPCIVHAFLYFWYEIISVHYSNFIEPILNILIKTFPQYWLYKAFSEYLPDENFFTHMAAKFLTYLLNTLGLLGFDPTASGAPLANSIGTGIDVVYNRYDQTNLGGREITNDPSAALAYKEANDEYYAEVAALPLKDRLFSTDFSGSLVSRMAVLAPADFSPKSILAAMFVPVRELSSSFMAAITGRSWADAATAKEINAVDGVGQFGGDLGEIDAGIPSEIRDQSVDRIQDVKCPANADGFFNNCQRYKEVIGAAMCADTKNPCPEYAQ
jgi:hypothetical protein